MAYTSNNYNNNDLELISPDGLITGSFGNTHSEYMKVVIYKIGLNGYRSIAGYSNKKTIFYSNFDLPYLNEDTQELDSSTPVMIYTPGIYVSSYVEAMNNFSINSSFILLGEPQYREEQGDYNIYTAANSHFKIFKNESTDPTSLYIKPNDILDSANLSSGNYEVQVSFYKQFPVIIDPKSQNDIIKPQQMLYEEFKLASEYTLPKESYDGIDPNIYNTIAMGGDFVQSEEVTLMDTPIDPSDIGTWSSVDFNRTDISQYLSLAHDAGTVEDIPHAENSSQIRDVSQFIFPRDRFILREISSTRKEVRLKLVNHKINDNITLKNKFRAHLGDPYSFRHILAVGMGLHVPIVSYHFDDITDGVEDQSIILRLYEPLPSSVQLNRIVSVEEEILLTNTTPIYYFATEEPTPSAGSLEIDFINDWDYDVYDGQNSFQSYDQVSSSLSPDVFNNIFTGSIYDYPNLNTDFNKFENHVFFGSAERKLENFKTKIGNLQSYYAQISESFTKSSSMGSDYPTVITERNSLFDKIQSEIKSFTPYEKFLYYDGQSETTSSAPGIGKNYARTYAVGGKNRFEPLSLHSPGTGIKWAHSKMDDKLDGLPQVYTLTHSVDVQASSNWFRYAYRAENKPFFNYSGSVYLSFYAKGDTNWGTFTGSSNQLPSPMRIQGHQQGFGTDYTEDVLDSSQWWFLTPSASQYHNTLVSSSLTGSEYRQFVFQASASYWHPSEHANWDTNNLHYPDFVDPNSNKITVLSGSVKTGSNLMFTDGQYQNLSTYASPSGSTSGVSFYGAIMPAGTLFDVGFDTPYISNVSGSWYVDTFASGSTITTNMLKDHSGAKNSGSVGGGSPKISDGLELHGRTYGKSMLFDSQSQDFVRFYIENENRSLNFNRDDNFSLSIWAKRYHPNTGSADSATAANNVQSIFTRGSVSQSYGIDYYTTANQIRAGVRGINYGAEQATYVMSDDALNWHHYVFTFESGSANGIKLYVDGILRDTNPTSGSTYLISGSNDFSQSNHLLTSDSETLTIGGDNIIAGGNANYNGYLQYPRIYSKTLNQDEVQRLYLNPDGILEAKITDVKVSLNNPSDVLPYDHLYQTASSGWTSWYNDIINSASAFDESNIHSLENNLPTYIQNSSEYDDLKQFLGLIGEHYDLVRNHIDGLGTLHNRKYNKIESVPPNLIVSMLDNMGWEAIPPFSSSIAEYFGNAISSITSDKDVKENTWRKTLNNLIYIYKTKGTKNAVRSLLNIYGYPPDALQVNEYGGSTELPAGTSTEIIDTDVPTQGTSPDETDLAGDTGNIGYSNSKQKLFHYVFKPQTSTSNFLNSDWYYNGADINTIEFVYKHRKSSNTQTILKSAGSGSEELWNIEVVPSSNADSSSIRFRLNNSQRGETNISQRGYSMSMAYNIKEDGELWNVMIQRMTGSIAGNGIQEYRFYAGLQDKDKIKLMDFASMSLSGSDGGSGADPNTQYYANQNWGSTGSRHALSSSNLLIGETFSGSISNIMAWTTALSASKFRMHTLDKRSTVGNSITSNRKELAYNFKFNENYNSSSISSSNQNLIIIDSAPKCNITTTYHTIVSGSVVTSSAVFGWDIIDVNSVNLSDNNLNLPNNKQIIINPDLSISNNLSHEKPSIKSLSFNKMGVKPKSLNSKRLDLSRSPQDFVNNYILQSIEGFNLETLYGNPANELSASYKQLDDFRKDFFQCSEVIVDTNKFIRSHENLLNRSLINSVKSVIPIRSSLSDKKQAIGVTIKPTILEKQRLATEVHSIESNPNSYSDTISIISESGNKGSISTQGSYVASKTSSAIIIDDLITKTYSYEPVRTSSAIIINDLITKTFSNETPKTGSIDPLPKISSSFTLPPSASNNYISTHYIAKFVNINNLWGTSSSDVHFLNMWTENKNTSSFGDYNVGHIESRYHFYMMGDLEVYSGSGYNHDDFSNQSKFHNRQNITTDVHKNITYNSYMNGNPGEQTGRAIGKTRYFYTASDGTITLPSNHVRRFSNPFTDQMNMGAQNINPGILQVQQEDYSTSSFYSVTVTGGENEIIVRSGKSEKGSDGKIMY